MRRLFTLISAVFVGLATWLSTAPAYAYNLVPCEDSAKFMERANTSFHAGDRVAAYARAGVLCGEDGLPHLIPDNFAHLGEFIIPGVLFLYIAGWIGWAGRSYLQAVKKSGNPEMSEIVIDLPVAIKFMIGGFAWPAMALKEMTTGEMFAKDSEIPVSPR